MFDAANQFASHRLPELFAGLDETAGHVCQQFLLAHARTPHFPVGFAIQLIAECEAILRDKKRIDGIIREEPPKQGANVYLTIDARIQTIYGGTTEIMKEIIGRSLGV